MVDVLALKSEIVRANLTQKEVYEGIGLTKRQWEIRLLNKKFDTDEMYKLTNFLHLSNPIPIFFADEVTQSVT